MSTQLCLPLSEFLLIYMPVTIFCVICLAIFALPNKAFAWVQYIGSMVKVILFLILVPLCIALIAGAGSTGSVHKGSTWTSLPPFKNGIKVNDASHSPDVITRTHQVLRVLQTALCSPSGQWATRSSSVSWEAKHTSLAGLSPDPQTWFPPVWVSSISSPSSSSVYLFLQMTTVYSVAPESQPHHSSLPSWMLESPAYLP